jgi:hypothetical protein
MNLPRLIVERASPMIFETTPSCQRKAAKNAGGLSGEGQALLCVQTAKKRPFS